jgi:hypothetical protein
MARRIVGLVPTAAAVLFVLFAYAFFGSAGTLEFRRVHWGTTLYTSQGQGFVDGKLTMAHTPDPALLALKNPYELKGREGLPYPFDASLFEGKYYLYFSPVPLLLFTIPYAFLARGWPPDTLMATFFVAWSFLASVFFARRAFRHVGGTRFLPFPLWVLILGVGNIVPFFLGDLRVYEVASACGMAMGATWAYTLLVFMEKPSLRTATVMGLFLALTIATRPNTIVLMVVAAAAVFLAKKRLMLAAAIPVMVVGLAYGAYNYARFRTPFETGLSYQLSVKPMQDETPCSLCTRSDLGRFFNTFMHYVFLPPKFLADFPWVELRYNDVDQRVSFPALPEQVGGFGAVTPLTMIATSLALLLLLARRTANVGLRTSMLLLAGAWIVMLTLSTCRWVTARYALDFYALLLLGSIVTIEYGVAFLRDAGVMVRPLRWLFATLAVYSILTGVFLGLSGPRGVFKERNPRMFWQVGRVLR